MEKQFQLDQREAQTFAQIDQGRTQALAAIGALSLDMEQARKNLESAVERHRMFVQAAVNARGLDNFENARIANGNLLVSLPDDPAAAPVAIPPAKSNGKEAKEAR